MGTGANKPDDIDQDVWDAAQAAFAGYGRAGYYDETLEIYEPIARAIMAERERCAAVAEDEIARVRQRMVETSDDPRMLVNQAWGMCGDTAAIIRDAIRGGHQ